MTDRDDGCGGVPSTGLEREKVVSWHRAVRVLNGSSGVRSCALKDLVVRASALGGLFQDSAMKLFSIYTWR